MNNRIKTAEAANWEPPKTIWNAMFLSIFFANMAMNMGQQMSNSLLSLYANSMGAPADQIGQLMSMFAVTALILRFVSGPAMNAYNRKYLLAGSMGFMLAAYLIFAYAQPIAAATGLEPILILKGGRLCQGVGQAFGNSCCLTIVSDTLPKDKFTAGMGYYACAQVIAQSIGPTVGVVMRDLFGYNLTYIVNAAVMAVAIVAALRVKMAPREYKPFKLNLNNMIAKEALVPAGVMFFIHTGFTSINAFLLVYAEERGIAGGSFFFTIYALTLLMTRPVVGRLTDKWGFVKVATPAVMLTVCSLAMIGFANNTVVLLSAAFVNAFGYGAVQPMLQSLCMKSVTPDRRGSASSTNYIGMDVAMLIGPSLCGAVADMMGYTPAMWLVMTIPVFIGLIGILLFRKKIGSIEKAFRG